MLRNRTNQVVAIVALTIAVFGVISGSIASPDTGVGIDDTGSVVISVLPGSPAWRDGIRPGQFIEELRDSTSAGGWALVARGGDVVYETSSASEEVTLRGSLFAAAVGLLLVLIGSVLLVRGVGVGVALLPLGVGLATTPLVLTGVGRDLFLAGISVAMVCTLAFVGVAGPKRGALVGICVLAFAVVWTGGVLGVYAAFPAADAARLPVALSSTLLVGWWAIDRHRVAKVLVSPGAPNAFDIAYLPGIVAMTLAGTLFLRLSPLAGAAIVVAAVLIYPWTRRQAVRSFEQLVIGNIRRSAESKAIEEERGRLAREIHDAPMQDLSAVIRRLEAVPGSASEVEALRDVIAQLRDIATSLHPPVLQDLGLAAALVDLGDALRVASPRREVHVEVDNLSAVGVRPPEEVETAAFRIVQEAVANALKHSSGTRVSIAGSVAPEAIDLAITDDGNGLDRRAAEAARRAGHFGLDSMRERAALIGGTTTVDSTANGVVVRFVWERAG